MNDFPNDGLRRKRHQSALMTEDKEQPTFQGRKSKKKALLIGVAQVRIPDTGETTLPRTLQRILKGSHRDVQAMKQLLVGKFIQFTSSD